jgi:bifunctional DNA primase/polymerase-like protein
MLLTVDYALAYASRGWAVFPLVPQDKVPMKGSHSYNDATTNGKTIRRWWTDQPDANIAIRTGQGSDLLIPDIDPRNHGDIVWNLLIEEYGEFPPTPTVITGSGGRHYYLSWADITPGNGALGTGVDLKADGGYVVAPPSIHPNGQPYEWMLETFELNTADTPSWIAKVRGGITDRISDTSRNGHHSISTYSMVNQGGVPERGLITDLRLAESMGMNPMGISADHPIGKKFRCVLHNDRRYPSAWLRLGSGGDLVYRCVHQGGYSLNLPQVRASLGYRQIAKLAQLLYDGFVLLLRLKSLIGLDKGSSYGRKFAAAWCDMTENEARTASTWLMRNGYLYGAGVFTSKFGKTSKVLKLGDRQGGSVNAEVSDQHQLASTVQVVQEPLGVPCHVG